MIHLSHVLFEPVVLRQNSLSRLDSRIKIAWCAGCLTLNLILPGNAFQISLLVFCAGIALSWGVRPRYIIARLFIPLLIGLFLMAAGMSGAHLALVILAGVSCLSLLSFSTPVDDMLSALREFRCPQVLIEIVYLMYKYIFILLEEMDRIYHAQAARLGYNKRGNSFNSVGILAGILILRSFERAGALYEALLSRGYKDKLFYS